MSSYMLVSAPLLGLFLAQAQIIPQATKPQEPAPLASQRLRFEAVPEPADPSPKISGPTLAAIEFRGARRLPQSVLRAIIASHAGGVYDLETLRRDSQALYNTGRFSNIAWETEWGPAGATVYFVVVERPLIQSIEYEGDDTVTLAEIVARFEQRKVKLRVETLYNDDELVRAAATVRELITERGRRNITVTPLVESPWPHATVKITFRVDESH